MTVGPTKPQANLVWPGRLGVHDAEAIAARETVVQQRLRVRREECADASAVQQESMLHEVGCAAHRAK